MWRVCFVYPDSDYLIDRTNSRRLATTDPEKHCVFLSNDVRNGGLLRTILVHELGHCAMFSYGLLPAIHSFVKPNRWIEAEEWVCNFIADYGDEIINIADNILSTDTFWLSNNHLFPRYSA